MARVQAVVVLPSVTEFPKDNAINTFTFSPFVPDEEALDNIAGTLEDFYNEVQLSGQSVASYLSSTIVRTTDACHIEFWDIDGTPPRTPMHVVPFTLAGPTVTNNNLPLEVALCSSFRAEYVSGEPAARRRGRVYVGPLTTGALTSGAGVPGTPSPTFIETVAQATMGLASAFSPLHVWSRTDDMIRRVVAGWVDNEFDTQRRREHDATAREAWSISV